MADVRVALVDDHPLFRNALAEVLKGGQRGDVFAIIEAGSLDELLVRLEAGLEIDLLLLDLGLPGLHGLLGLLSFRSAHPTIPVIVVSGEPEPAVAGRCMMLGAAAFVPKSGSMQEIREAVAAVLAGGRWVPEILEPMAEFNPANKEFLVRLSSLSPRELQVCLALGKGLLNKQIAAKFEITEATVKAHVSHILEKLGVASRTRAVVLLQQLDGKAAAFHDAVETARVETAG